MSRAHRLHHHLRSPWKRGVYSFSLVALVLAVGTIGMHVIERMPYLDAFYFMSMLATSQGPIVTPMTAAGKLFASVLAFISVGTVVAAVGFLFGPFLGTLWRIGVERLEEEAQSLRKHREDGKGTDVPR